MIVKTEMQLINTPVKTFIAEDGTPFTSESACRDYEIKSKREAMLGEAAKFMIHDGYYAPCNSGENYESHIYKWFKVENQEQVDILNKLFNVEFYLKTFPEIVCVEQHYDNDFEDCWVADTLSGCIRHVKEFFEEGFGYDVTITKKT